MSADRIDEITAEAADRFMDWVADKGMPVLVVGVVALSLVTVVAQIGMKGGWW